MGLGFVGCVLQVHPADCTQSVFQSIQGLLSAGLTGAAWVGSVISMLLGVTSSVTQ